jgi:chloramphenicol 3-O phosphotransferase
MSTVVVLNGTSSSGKTTLARAFQELAGSLFLNFSIDSILYALPQRALDRIVAGTTIPDLPYLELHTAYYACVRELAALGRDLVIDNAITSRAQAERLVAAVTGHRVLLVSVASPPEVLERRERARGDRNIGLASRQLATIDRWLEYDLRIDTSVLNPNEGAERIVAALTQDPLTAFERTCARMLIP